MNQVIKSKEKQVVEAFELCQQKTFIVNIEGFGNKAFRARSLAHLIKDLEMLRINNVAFTIICEEKRGI